MHEDVEAAGARLWGLLAGAALVFAAHAACYLYFFVDDAAIPAVYAQNLLAGRGLVYNALEGRVEGYSDFLNVIIDALLLALTRVLHQPKIEVLHLGVALSFAFGVGVVILTGAMLARSGARLGGVAAGLACVALAGPLAVWSCSSLEAVPFAFFVLAFAGATLVTPIRPRAAAVFAIVAILYRVDGFVFVGAVFAGALLADGRADQRRLLLRVAVPVAAATAAYHLFRLAYFHSVLTAPLEAKVLYKLAPPPHAIVKAPGRSYLGTFADVYGVALVPVLLAAGAAIVRTRRARGLLAATALIILYVGVVGDWMFGWRFLVPVLPLGALVIGLAVSRARGAVGWTLAVAVMLWSAVGARAVARQFVDRQHKPIWWTSPRAGTNVWLAPYGELVSAARKLVAPGETIAYNQAGLVPFLLDAENIDDLGICSRFEARLPITDVYFTEVGRYAPLTDAPVFNAVHSYLLYRGVQVVISRTDLLTSANHGEVPSTILDGYFALHSVDRSGENAIYLRTDKPADEYQRDPSTFQEDLIHTSHIQRADLDGAVLPFERIGPSFPFLRWQSSSLHVRGTSRVVLRFAAHDEDAAVVYARSVSASSPVAITFSLYTESGRLTASVDVLANRTPAMLLRRLAAGTRGRVLVIDIRSSETEATVTFDDLRLNGQSAALRNYIKRNLVFPVQ